MLVHHRVTSQHLKGHQYPFIHLRGESTVRVKCLAQEHNTMSPARARTLTAHSRVEHTNNEATESPTLSYESLPIIALVTQKYQNIIPGEVDKGPFTIHPHVPRFYLFKEFSLESEIHFIFLLFTRYSQP